MRRDLAAAHEHVVVAVEPGARVQHAGAADQELGGRPRRGDEDAHAGCGSGVGGAVGAPGSARTS